MNPWHKERTLKEVTRWMFNEDPKIWFTPGAVTRKNEHGLSHPLTPALSITEAEEIFRELARRKVIEDVYPTVEYVENGETKKGTISAWRINRAEPSRTTAWIESRGIVANGIRPIWNFFPDKLPKLWLLVAFIIGAFVTGFLTRSGELLSDKWFSPVSNPQTEKRVSESK
jgi:hypothetical protein